MRGAALVAVLSIAFASGCAGKRIAAVPHCQTSEEYGNSDRIDEQWYLISLAEDDAFGDFLFYVDELESNCIAVNAARGESWWWAR